VYIYEPWKMPKALQERLGVVVGVSYPARVVVHEDASKANIERHTRAYAANKAGGSMPAAAPGAGGAGTAQVGSDPAESIAYLRSPAGTALLGSAVGERAAAAAPAGAAGAGAGAGTSAGAGSAATSAGSISGGGAGAASSGVGFKSKARRDAESGGGAGAAFAAPAGGAGDSSDGATGGSGAALAASKRPRTGSS
jgi:hypothetical protein